MNSIDNTYRFLFDKEPSDEQLSLIMKEVAQDAKKAADEAYEVFINNLNNQIKISNSKNKTKKK